jgi:uncharacterized protein (DUF885 family)
MTQLHLTRRSATALGLAALAAPAAAAAPADARFEALGARYIDELARLSPISATGLGDHRFDADLDNLSATGRARRLVSRKALLKDFEALKPAELSRANQVDLALVKNRLAAQVWTAEVLQDWAWDPQVYSGAAGSSLYGLMAREYAPLDVRLRAATARMEKLPGLFAQARASLRPARVPLVHAQTASAQNKGVLAIVDQQILPHAGKLPAADQSRLRAAEATLRAAVAEHQAWLDKTLVPNARGDFRLGAELYDAKLNFALNSPMTRAQIRATADKALKDCRAEMYAISRKLTGEGPEAPDAATQQAVIEKALERVVSDHPPRDRLFAAARAAMNQAEAFLRARPIITMPDTAVEVIPMPVFQRGSAVASCSSPGALEKGQKTFYNISPIPEDWTAAQAESFLREYNRLALHDVGIHEAMPGHYVQLWHANRYPSTLRAVLGSGPFIEGWGVYAEDMMSKVGYLDGDPKFRLQILKNRIRSITNAIIDQMVHVDGVERDAFMTFLTVDAFQQEREAAGKWTRAQLSSTQLPSYFVGVTEHDALRAEAERRAGAAFNLKGYHDKVLSFGSPPGRYVWALMFDEAIG